jgi:hypothetical protein
MSIRPPWLPLLVALVVTAAACGNTDAAQSSPTDPPTTVPAATSGRAADTTDTTAPPLARALGRTEPAAAGQEEQEDQTGDEQASDDDRVDATRSERALGNLEVGDCLDLPTTTEAGDSGATDAELRPCDQPHDAEVYSRVSLDEDPGAPYPGDEHVLPAADRVCFDTFSRQIGTDYVDSDLEIVHFRPNAAAWARRDRVVVCAVVSMDGQPLVGSVTGDS